MGSYQQLRESGRGVQIVNAIVETARLCNLDKDVTLPDDDSSDLTLEDRDAIVGAIYRQLMEIESRLLPCGLHTIGKPPTAEEAIATLVSIAALEREEEGLRSLPGLLAESLGRKIEDIYKGNDDGVLEDVELNRTITEVSRAAVGGHGAISYRGRWSRQYARKLWMVPRSDLTLWIQTCQCLGSEPVQLVVSQASTALRLTHSLPICVFASNKSAQIWKWRAC